MKVEKIYQNYDQNRNVKVNRNYSSVSFAKSPSIPDQIKNRLADKKILNYMSDKLDWMKGEVGGVAMTALGTGLVAPWPIAFNPFVKAKKGATEAEKEDVKNTKYYTAWRQPISAVLAAIIQVNALTPIDKLLDYLYNTPKTAKWFDVDTNHSLINRDKFIERRVKKEMKKEGLTKSSMGKEQFNDELKARTKAIENKQIANVANKIKETHTIQVGEKFIDNYKVANLVNESIDEYIKDTQKLKIDNKGLAFYSQRAKVLIDNEAYLKELLKNAPTEEKALESYIKNLLSKETNPDLKVLLQEILDRDPAIRYNRIQDSLLRIDKINKLCNGNFCFDTYMDAMAKRNAELDKIITKFNMIKINDVKSATPETIKKALKSAIDICHFNEKNPLLTSILSETGTFNVNKKTITDKVYTDLAKGYKEFVKNSYKSPSQVWKIAIGIFITLPLTCNILNWVYPRFMDKFFPKLAGSKAKQKAREKEAA